MLPRILRYKVVDVILGRKAFEVSKYGSAAVSSGSEATQVYVSVL
jgi:hypothetical protein